MIRKLNQIRGFGLFRDFSWGALQEFKRYNLIYGWNYSGKTTLSRIFQSLEHGVILPEFLGCEFQATLEDGSILGTHSITPYSKIRVFNRPFVENNFNAGMTGAKMIVVVGAENIKLKDRLNQLQARQAKVSQIKENFELDAKTIDDDLKAKATSQGIVISTLFGDRNYDRRHLLAEVRGLPDDCGSLILSDSDHDKLVEEWRRAGDYKKLNTIIYAVYSIIERSLSSSKQLIVLTHNADFFGVVKDWMKKQNPSFYMVNRLLDAGQNWYSNIIPLPRLLAKFKSDYLYTYHCLKSIDSNPTPSLEELCGVPNMIRKLLEAYLGFRYPGVGGLGEKLNKLFPDEMTQGEIIKFTDEFSHSHYLHRAMGVPDYTSHCKRMVSHVLGALRIKDIDHVTSLEAELNS